MSILSNLTKLGAIVALTASVVALPAAAQNRGNGFKSFSGSKFNGSRRSNFNSRRGNFKGRRSNFNGRRGFSNRGVRRSNLSRRNSFNRGFKGNSFNRGFRGNSFNRGFRRNSFNRGFRGNSFNRGFGLGVVTNTVVVSAPLYSVGGFYGVTGNTVIISDFGIHGLYAPPRGYHWVCDKGSNDAVLAAVATGAIIAVAAGVLATPY